MMDYRERYIVPGQITKKLGVKGKFRYFRAGQFVFDGDENTLYEPGQEIQIEMNSSKRASLDVEVVKQADKSWVIDDQPKTATHRVVFNQGKYEVQKL